MAYYSYKEVVYSEAFIKAKAELEAKNNQEYDDDPNYDGDAWHITAYLIKQQADTIQQLRDDRWHTFLCAFVQGWIAKHGLDGTPGVYIKEEAKKLYEALQEQGNE
jgi:hypothetical protein